jgi:hypothetical protein
MNSDISLPSYRGNRFYQGHAATFVANALQAVNFLGDRFLRKSHHPFTAIEDLYRHSMDSAFSVTEAFLVTGAPHASAYYPRDFAWFYPDVLDPETIMDSQDAVRRVHLLEKSVRLLLEAVRANVVTTTIVPAGRGRYLGVNYFSHPSDTLLGILAGLQQMISADERASSYLAMSQCARAGRLLLAEYGSDLKRAILQLASELEPFDDGIKYLLCDARAARSAATDTRAERRRFVTNACVYTTFVWGVQLGVVDENELKRLLGRDLAQYKRDLLGLFGKDGYIRHSLDGPKGSPVSSVALDFVSVHRGFWDMSEANERALFAATTDLIIAEPRFRIPSTFHFLVSADNPRNKMIHKIAAPAYQGRSSWPTFNVEFADRMLDYDEFSGDDTYRACAQGILKDIRTATEVHGGYQELISEQGLKYRTWAYKGAVAHSWFPRFLSVWRRAHGTPLLRWND